MAAPKVPNTHDRLEIGRETEIRRGFLDGEGFAIPGGSPEHSVTLAGLLIAAGRRLRRNPCQAFPPGQAVAQGTGGRYVSPDLSIASGPVFAPTPDRSLPNLVALVLEDAGHA